MSKRWLVLGCCAVLFGCQSERPREGMPLHGDSISMKQEIISRLPPHPTVDQAYTVLKANGFDCTFGKTERNQPCLTCTAREKGFVSTVVYVQVMYDETRNVTDIKVSSGLIGL